MSLLAAAPYLLLALGAAWVARGTALTARLASKPLLTATVLGVVNLLLLRYLLFGVTYQRGESFGAIAALTLAVPAHLTVLWALWRSLDSSPRRASTTAGVVLALLWLVLLGGLTYVYLLAQADWSK